MLMDAPAGTGGASLPVPDHNDGSRADAVAVADLAAVATVVAGTLCFVAVGIAGMGVLCRLRNAWKSGVGADAFDVGMPSETAPAPVVDERGVNLIAGLTFVIFIWLSPVLRAVFTRVLGGCRERANLLGESVSYE